MSASGYCFSSWRAYGVHLRSCLRQRHSWLEARPGFKIIGASEQTGILVRRQWMGRDVPPRRHPELTVIVRREVHGHHSDYHVRLAVQRDVMSQQPTIGPKATLPKTVAKHYHMVIASLLIVRKQTAPKQRTRRQTEERNWRKRSRTDTFGALATGQVALKSPRCGHRRKNVILRRPIQIICRRYVAPPAPCCAASSPRRHDAV